MNQTVTIPAKMIDEIFSRLDELTKAVKKISVKLLNEEPPYGSNAWWTKDIEDAEKEFKKGKGVLFKSSKDAIKWLSS